MVTKNTIKQWFRNKLKPTQEQFWAWMDSYWHKDEKIPVSLISGLEKLLNSVATVGQMEALIERISLIENAERKGLQDDKVIALAVNEATKYTFPSTSILYAIELKGVATVQLGSSESSMGDLGEITGSAGAFLQVGLLKIDEIWLQSDNAVEVVPIIYKR